MAFTDVDRLVLARLYHLVPGVLNALKIVKPETVIRWHHAGFRAYWRRRSGHLLHLLRCYASYYNRSRTHLSLNKDAPTRRPVHTLGSIEARPVLGGRHHHL